MRPFNDSHFVVKFRLSPTDLMPNVLTSSWLLKTCLPIQKVVYCINSFFVKMHWQCVTLSVGCSVSQSMRKETFLTVSLLRGQFIYYKIHSPEPKVGGAEDKDTICVYHEQEVYFSFSCYRVCLMEISTTIKMLVVECTVKYVFKIVFTLPLPKLAVKKHIFCCIFQTFKIYMKTAWYIYILLSLKKIIIAMGLCTFL